MKSSKLSKFYYTFEFAWKIWLFETFRGVWTLKVKPMGNGPDHPYLLFTFIAKIWICPQSLLQRRLRQDRICSFCFQRNHFSPNYSSISITFIFSFQNFRFVFFNSSLSSLLLQVCFIFGWVCCGPCGGGDFQNFRFYWKLFSWDRDMGKEVKFLVVVEADRGGDEDEML